MGIHSKMVLKAAGGESQVLLQGPPELLYHLTFWQLASPQVNESREPSYMSYFRSDMMLLLQPAVCPWISPTSCRE